MKKIPLVLLARSLSDSLIKANSKITEDFIAHIKELNSEYGEAAVQQALLKNRLLHIRRAVIKVTGSFSYTGKEDGEKDFPQIYFSRSHFGAKNKAEIEFIFD